MKRTICLSRSKDVAVLRIAERYSKLEIFGFGFLEVICLIPKVK
jgi:hypothetical protein